MTAAAESSMFLFLVSVSGTCQGSGTATMIRPLDLESRTQNMCPIWPQASPIWLVPEYEQPGTACLETKKGDATLDRFH